MIPQINPGLMQVLNAANTINPVTPQGGQSVAARVLTEAQQAQTPGIEQLRAALPTMQQNAQGQQAVRTVHDAQKAQQNQQNPGIAGLDVNNLGKFADGGVVGFAGGGAPDTDDSPWWSRPRTAPPPSWAKIEGVTRKVDPDRPGGVADLPAVRRTTSENVPGGDLYERARKETLEQKAPEELTEQQRYQQRVDNRRARGLPDSLRAGEEDRIKQIEAFDAQARADNAQRNKDAMQGAWGLGALQPGAMNMFQMFGGAARGMFGEEAKQRDQAVKDVALQREQMMVNNAIRAKLDEADQKEADGDTTGAQAAREAARVFANSLKTGIAKIDIDRAKEVTDYAGKVDAARITAAESARARQNLPVNVRMLNEFGLAQAKKEGKDINDPAVQGSVLREAIRQAAESQSGVGTRQQREALKLLQKSLQSAVADISKSPEEQAAKRQELDEVERQLAELGGLPSPSAAPSGQPLPPVGTVMQGYRFKGGNPAERNNWEKV